MQRISHDNSQGKDISETESTLGVQFYIEKPPSIAIPFKRLVTYFFQLIISLFMCILRNRPIPNASYVGV